MADPTKAPEPVETIETTPISDWLIPNQDKFERVIDARLEKLKESEKPKSSRSHTASSIRVKEADSKS